MAVLIISLSSGSEEHLQTTRVESQLLLLWAFFFLPPRFLSWVSLFPNFPAFLICRFEIGSTLLCLIFDCWRCCTSCYFGIRFGIFFFWGFAGEVFSTEYCSNIFGDLWGGSMMTTRVVRSESNSSSDSSTSCSNTRVEVSFTSSISRFIECFQCSQFRFQKQLSYWRDYGQTCRDTTSWSKFASALKSSKLLL